MNKTTDKDDEVRQKMSDEKDKLIPLLRGTPSMDALLDLIGSTSSQLETLQRIMGISTLLTAMSLASKSKDESLTMDNANFAASVEEASFKLMDCIVLIRLYKEKFEPFAKAMHKIAHQDESKN